MPQVRHTTMYRVWLERDGEYPRAPEYGATGPEGAGQIFAERHLHSLDTPTFTWTSAEVLVRNLDTNQLFTVLVHRKVVYEYSADKAKKRKDIK